jgi:hypothetical protein
MILKVTVASRGLAELSDVRTRRWAWSAGEFVPDVGNMHQYTKHNTRLPRKGVLPKSRRQRLGTLVALFAVVSSMISPQTEL